MLVIHPDECIDCGVCEPERPVEAIKPDTEPGAENWLKLNADYAKTWPNITIKRDPPGDLKDWEGKPDKLKYFSPNPGACHWGVRSIMLPPTLAGRPGGEAKDGKPLVGAAKTAFVTKCKKDFM